MIDPKRVCLLILTAIGVLGPWREAVAAQDGAPGSGEGVRLFGRVLDRSTGLAVPFAEVSVTPSGAEGDPLWQEQASSSGRFQVDALPLGTYEMVVEISPFSTFSHTLELSEAGIVDVRVQMVRVDYALEPIVAVARRQTKLEREGFYERQQAGRGYFLTRAEVEDRAVTQLSELFRTVPGTRVIQGRNGRGNDVRLRSGCIPVYVLDGVVMSGAPRVDELLPVSGLEGIEVYHGSAAPMQYVGMTSCGVVMLWTRDPLDDEGRDFSWGRLFVAAGMAILVALGAG